LYPRHSSIVGRQKVRTELYIRLSLVQIQHTYDTYVCTSGICPRDDTQEPTLGLALFDARLRGDGFVFSWKIQDFDVDEWTCIFEKKIQRFIFQLQNTLSQSVSPFLPTQIVVHGKTVFSTSVQGLTYTRIQTHVCILRFRDVVLQYYIQELLDKYLLNLIK